MTGNIIGKKVIIRGGRSGVFFGTLVAKEGTEVKLENCRRLWRWRGACSVSQLAAEGTKEPDGCMFTVYVDEIIITDVVEILTCTDESIKSIEGVNAWKK